MWIPAFAGMTDDSVVAMRWYVGHGGGCSSYGVVGVVRACGDCVGMTAKVAP